MGRPIRTHGFIFGFTALLAPVILLAACTGSSSGAALISNPRWMAGDSVTYQSIAYMAVPTFDATQGSNGFVRVGIGTIESKVVDLLAGVNHPAVVLVSGGINDAAYVGLPETLVAMQHFEDTMTAQSIRTVWITEAVFDAWQGPVRVAFMAATNGWMLTRPFHADCGVEATTAPGANTFDGVHPNAQGNIAYAACVDGVG